MQESCISHEMQESCISYPRNIVQPNCSNMSNTHITKCRKDAFHQLSSSRSIAVFAFPYICIASPMFAWSSMLEVAKKNISFFMPNRLIRWNSQTRTVNPTRSINANDLIKCIKKKEVRKEGRKSSAHRAMNIEEFGVLVERLCASEQGLKR